MPIVEEISKQEQAALKRALRLHGAVQQMMLGANLSRRAIVNLRDFGRADKTTVQKVRDYLKQKNEKAAA